MDRDAEGIEFAIKVPATRKPLLLILRTRFARSGEFAIVVPATQKRLLLLLRIHYVRSGEWRTRCHAEGMVKSEESKVYTQWEPLWRILRYEQSEFGEGETNVFA